MKLELKGIEYHATNSQETYCYSATVYVDGRPTVAVSNAGHGGGDIQHPVKGARYTVREVDEWCKSHLDKWELYDGEMAETDLEKWCWDMVEEWLLEKDLRRALRSKILYVEEGQLYESRYKGVRTLTARHLAHWRQQHPDVMPLNDMPIDKALAKYKALVAA